MGNDLAEQQVNNKNKAKPKQQMEEQLSSPLPQVLKTYDIGNFGNCELKAKSLYPHLYHKHRDLHRMI